MSNPFYYRFHKRLLEQEEIKPDPTSTLEKVLTKSKKVTQVMTALLTSQKEYGDKAKKELREIVADIRFMSYNPTTFRVIIKNGNYFDLKYDPTPLELKNPGEYKPTDSFIVSVSGKKYNISNNSEMEQAVDYINNLLQSKPVTKEPESIQEPGQEAGGGEEGGAEGGGEETPAPPEGEEAPPEEEKAK